MELRKRARVPVLKLHLIRVDVHLDFTVNNYTGRVNSELLRRVFGVYPPLQQLTLLLKRWACHHNLLGGDKRLFNSYCLTMLAVYSCQLHGQVPPLSQLVGNGD